jgi:hypothetical protein
MKNFKIAMILVAVVALFSSCKKEGPAITSFTEKNETIAYDLSSASSLPLELEGSLTAEAGISTVTVTRTVMNGEETVESGTKTWSDWEEDPAGLTEFSFIVKDTLFKANLASGYSVEYKVEVADKKDQTDNKSYTITITETATPISANWSEPIYLTRPSSVTAQSSTINGTIIRESENTTIGVKIINDQTSTQGKAQNTTNCEGFVIVNNDEYANVEALEAAYTAGDATTNLLLDFDYQNKAYTEMNFIAKVDNTYVLVKYSKGFVYASNHDGNQGQVFGFTYKKAETTPAAAK